MGSSWLALYHCILPRSCAIFLAAHDGWFAYQATSSTSINPSPSPQRCYCAIASPCRASLPFRYLRFTLFAVSLCCLPHRYHKPWSLPRFISYKSILRHYYTHTRWLFFFTIKSPSLFLLMLRLQKTAWQRGVAPKSRDILELFNLPLTALVYSTDPLSGTHARTYTHAGARGQARTRKNTLLFKHAEIWNSSLVST